MRPQDAPNVLHTVEHIVVVDAPFADGSGLVGLFEDQHGLLFQHNPACASYSGECGGSAMFGALLDGGDKHWSFAVLHLPPITSPVERRCEGLSWRSKKAVFRSCALVFALGVSGIAHAGEYSELFRKCLTGSDNPQLVREAKRACTQYLSLLMADVRFGIVTDRERNAPFCLPARELTDQETNLLFTRIKADGHGMIRDGMEDIVAGVVITKAYRCNQ